MNVCLYFYTFEYMFLLMMNSDHNDIWGVVIKHAITVLSRTGLTKYEDWSSAVNGQHFHHPGPVLGVDVVRQYEVVL